MEEVGSRDMEGVSGPAFEAWIILFDVEYDGGGVPGVGSHHGCRDELGLASGILEYSQGIVRRSPQVDGTEVDAQGSLDDTVVPVRSLAIFSFFPA